MSRRDYAFLSVENDSYVLIAVISRSYNSIEESYLHFFLFDLFFRVFRKIACFPRRSIPGPHQCRAEQYVVVVTTVLMILFVKIFFVYYLICDRRFMVDAKFVKWLCWMSYDILFCILNDIVLIREVLDEVGNQQSYLFGIWRFRTSVSSNSNIPTDNSALDCV